MVGMIMAACALPLCAVFARAADQSQNFEIDVLADETNQWTGQRNTVWNSWGSHPAHGFAFLRDPDKWMGLRWQPNQVMNVRIMGGMRDPSLHHWMLGVKNGEPVCDFTGLIEILSAELDHGLKPCIVLDEVPWALAVRTAPGRPSAKTMKYWHDNYGNFGPPRDYDLWKKYIRQFLNACVDAFGHEEVSRWQYRVTTEPDNPKHWGGTWEEYIIHYDHTVDAVTDVVPNAWVGPGNFIGEWLADESHKRHGRVREFVEHCVSGTNHATGRKGARMTFLAFSAYTRLANPEPTAAAFPHEIAFRRAREILDEYPQLNKYLDNDAAPDWFAIEVHEYGDLTSLAGKEWLWMTEWMAGLHAHVLDLAYNDYGVLKTCFWFQSQWYNQFYPYVRVSQLLSEMEGGTLVKVDRKTASSSPKVKHGAIAAWKDGSLYVMVYNFNWDPLHQGTLRGKRNHTIDNTITLNITGKSISDHANWSLHHTIINEQSGNACWYYQLKQDLDAHPDLKAQKGNFYQRLPWEGWKGPAEEIIFSRHAYADNGLYEKYRKLSQIGVVGTGVPVKTVDGKITTTSKPFTQSGVQLLKFTPVH